MIRYSLDWKDYELLDSGDGRKLERWGDLLISRPDPLAIWSQNSNVDWTNVNYAFEKTTGDGDTWFVIKNNKKSLVYDFPQRKIKYKNFYLHFTLTKFKHTLIFPEQAINWEYLMEYRGLNVLNLFAYTGGSTLALLYSNNKVTHVDASGSMIGFAKKNVEISNLNINKVRFIKEDVNSFVAREIRRHNSYDGIILDPPSYGRGSKGELWQLGNMLPQLLRNIKLLLSYKAKFVMLNIYANQYSLHCFENLCMQVFPDSTIKSYELGIKHKYNEFILPAGGTVLIEF